MIRRRTLLSSVAAATLTTGALSAHAQSYPTRPIRLVVGFAPGGANDILARLYAQRMQSALQQPVVVENRPGANSIVAAEHVAKSAPDGYTLLVASNGLMTVNPAIYSTLKYDPEKDFEMVGEFANYPYVLIVRSGAGLDNMAALKALAAQRELTHGVGSSVFQLAGEYIARQAGIKVIHVPYRGSAPTITAVLSGEIDFAIVDIGSVVSFVQSGRINALAVTTKARSNILPQVPPVGALGLGDSFQVTAWTGLAAPKGIDASVAAALRSALQVSLLDPDVGSQLRRLGMEPGGLANPALLRKISDERTQWTKLAREAGIKAE
jgi:tripartite-type tricarboxylate transporter receptor subunit TctC